MGLFTKKDDDKKEALRKLHKALGEAIKAHDDNSDGRISREEAAQKMDEIIARNKKSGDSIIVIADKGDTTDTLVYRGSIIDIAQAICHLRHNYPEADHLATMAMASNSLDELRKAA